MLFFMCFFFLKVPFFFSGRSEIHVFLGFSYRRKNIFFYCVFYFPIIRLSFPIDRKKMRSQDVITEKQREIRKADLQHQEEKRDRERLEAQKNQNFTQVYPLGWKRLAELAKGNSAAFGFYTYLAQHIDGSLRRCRCRPNISCRTIQRHNENDT